MRNDNQATVSLEEFENESDLHLWLADVVGDINFDSFEKKDGARQLVEEVAYRLGTHGRQVLEQITDEGENQ